MSRVERTWLVNGARVKVEFEPEARLLDVLRDRLGLKAVKEGCGEGECGACSVIIDGDLKLSCLQLAAALPDGTEVLTAEGLEHTPEGRMIQEEANKRGAVQCGYCTPGMMAAIYWLVENPDIPAKEGLSGNLCRCTGYYRIIEAVKLASQKMKEER